MARNERGENRRYRSFRSRPNDDGFRPNERAAGGPSPRRVVGADDGGVLPRPPWDGRFALRRQYFPFLASRFGGFRVARTNAVGGRLPTDVGVGNGRVTGTNRVDEPRRDYFRSSGLRSGGRPDRPGAGDRVRPVGRVRLPRPFDLRKGDLSCGRPVGVVEPRSRPAIRWARALRLRSSRSTDAAKVPRTARRYRDFGRRRIERKRQTDRSPSAPRRAVPVATVPRRRGLHR